MTKKKKVEEDTFTIGMKIALYGLVLLFIIGFLIIYVFDEESDDEMRMRLVCGENNMTYLLMKGGSTPFCARMDKHIVIERYRIVHSDHYIYYLEKME